VKGFQVKIFDKCGAVIPHVPPVVKGFQVKIFDKL